MARRRLATLTTLGMLLLTACGGASTGSHTSAGHSPTSGPAAASSPAASTSPTASRYESLEELKKAAVTGGYSCPSWKRSDEVKLAQASGSCSDSDVFSIYADTAKLQQQVKTYKNLQKASAAVGLDPGAILVGPNWIINADDAGALTVLWAHLNGNLISGPEPSAAPSASYTPRKADWRVKLKIKKQQCFGSAGCNVTVGVTPQYVGSSELPDSGTIEVTYKIVGSEDSLVDTFTVENSQVSYTPEQDLSTSSASVHLRAKVTSVTYSDQ